MNFPTASEAYITTNAFVEDLEKQKAIESGNNWKASLKIIGNDIHRYIDNRLIKALQEAFRHGKYDLSICISKSIDMVSMVDTYNHYNHCELDQDYTNEMIDEFADRINTILESLEYNSIMHFRKSHNIDPKLKTNAYYYTINFSWHKHVKN
jgi:hypothetical protein